MYTFPYEEFLVGCYPVSKPAFEIPTDSQCILSLGRQRAIRYLEMNCSAVYGFPCEARHCRDMSQLAVGMMPSSYESSLCLDLLKDEDIHPTVIATLERVVETGRRSSGLWNFFSNLSDKVKDYFPDDIDDTGCSAGVLYQLGKLNLKECTGVANVMLDSAMIGPNGGMGSWIPAQRSYLDGQLISKYRLFDRAREDIGSMVNALWFLAQIGMDTDERALSSVHCVNQFLDEHLKSPNATLKHFMIYYTNRYVIYFLIARYLDKSSYARKLFGEKFANIVKISLLDMNTENANVLHVACCVLAAVKLGLHKEGNGDYILLDRRDVEMVREKIVLLTKVILSQQFYDGSFPACKLYRWDRTGYFAGSKTSTTCFALSALTKVQSEMEELQKMNTVAELAIY